MLPNVCFMLSHRDCLSSLSVPMLVRGFPLSVCQLVGL